MSQKPSIYLDYNASTPLSDKAKEAMQNALNLVGNPSSVHGFGRKVSKEIESAREDIATSINCDAAYLIFTSGATEANNMALKTMRQNHPKGNIYISAIEHDSIRAPALKHKAKILPVTKDGIIDLAALESSLEEDNKHSSAPALVSIMAANNEIGTIQPIKEISQIAKKYGALFHCDAAQAFGKIPLDFTSTDADFMTISAHKIGGPAGIGVLILKRGIETSPLQYGGGQERKRRPGTENTIGIIGMAAAAKDAISKLDNFAKISKLRDRLEQKCAAAAPEAIFFGQNAPRLPNTSMIALPHINAQTQMMALDLAGYAVSSGAACSSGTVSASHVLTAITDKNIADKAIRISLGLKNTKTELDDFLEIWKKIATKK